MTKGTSQGKGQDSKPEANFFEEQKEASVPRAYLTRGTGVREKSLAGAVTQLSVCFKNIILDC